MKGAMYQMLESEFGEEKIPTTKFGIVVARLQQGLTAFMMIIFVITFAMGLSVEVVTLLGSIFLVVVDTIVEQDIEVPKKLFRAIQWDVIMVFGALFIVVHTFNQTQIPRYLWSSCYFLMKLSVWGPAFFSVVLILLSTLVSNVPVVLMVAPEMKSKLAWIVLSWAITVGGNFTIISSAANIIVDEKANSLCPKLRLGSWNYFKFGAFSTFIVTLCGTYLIILIGKMYDYNLEV
jgi:Na+/H+ antiporter NhaD/arsenite permease-like protein